MAVLAYSSYKSFKTRFIIDNKDNDIKITSQNVVEEKDETMCKMARYTIQKTEGATIRAYGKVRNSAVRLGPFGFLNDQIIILCKLLDFYVNETVSACAIIASLLQFLSFVTALQQNDGC